MTDLPALDVNEKAQAHRKLLFVACFIALVATAFAFLIRSFILDDLRLVFNLTETQKGEINGAGFWPFAISIIVFSLIIDRIGYGKAMIFAFACHVGSVVLMFMAKGYWTLYFAAVLCALAAGTVEAVVNPVIASMFPKQKTKMLTILHAGWAGGLCLAGILTLSLTPSVTGWIKDLGIALWQLKAGLLLIPTFAYGIMMLFCKFPINERVVAGVPYKDMLKEAGALSILIVSFMIFKQLGALGVPMWGVVTGVVVCTVAMFAYSGSLGRPMYVFLLLVMILLAITEISTDGWIKDLMAPAMKNLQVGSKTFHLSGGWVLVYTSFLMMLLRFGISPFVKILKPLGVLLMGSLFAAAGLFFLSGAEGAWMLLLFATIYGIGQAFFWPVTIGLVAEQFPRGGALTLNAIAGVGMLATGIIGFPLLGMLQDRQIDAQLADKPALVAMANPEEKESIFGAYRGLDSNKVKLMEAQKNLADVAVTDEASASTVRDAYDLLGGKDATSASHADMVTFLGEKGALVLPADGIEQVKSDLVAVDDIRAEAKHKAMAQIAILPLIMAGCYIGLMIYFRKKGGYKAIDLSADGEVVGSHAVTPAEAIADAEATPSE